MLRISILRSVVFALSLCSAYSTRSFTQAKAGAIGAEAPGTFLAVADSAKKGVDGAADAAKKGLDSVAEIAREVCDWLSCETWKKREASWGSYVRDALITWAIWMLLSVMVWQCCYPSEWYGQSGKSAAILDEDDPVEVFNTRRFGCFDTPLMCLYACFCPAVRWADTISKVGSLRMSVALLCFFVCGLLNALTFESAIFYGLFTSLLILYYRQRIRDMLSLPSWTCRTCCLDVLYVLICPCCAIAQEARVLEAYGQQDDSQPADKPAGLSQTQLPPGARKLTPSQQWSPSTADRTYGSLPAVRSMPADRISIGSTPIPATYGSFPAAAPGAHASIQSSSPAGARLLSSHSPPQTGNWTWNPPVRSAVTGASGSRLAATGTSNIRHAATGASTGTSPYAYASELPPK